MILSNDNAGDQGYIGKIGMLIASIPIIISNSIAYRLACERRLVIDLSNTPNLNKPAVNYSVAVEVYGVKASKLKRYIDVIASRNFLHQNGAKWVGK